MIFIASDNGFNLTGDYASFVKTPFERDFVESIASELNLQQGTSIELCLNSLTSRYNSTNATSSDKLASVQVNQWIQQVISINAKIIVTRTTSEPGFAIEARVYSHDRTNCTILRETKTFVEKALGEVFSAYLSYILYNIVNEPLYSIEHKLFGQDRRDLNENVASNFTDEALISICGTPLEVENGTISVIKKGYDPRMTDFVFLDRLAQIYNKEPKDTLLDEQLHFYAERLLEWAQIEDIVTNKDPNVFAKFKAIFQGYYVKKGDWEDRLKLCHLFFYSLELAQKATNGS